MVKHTFRVERVYGKWKMPPLRRSAIARAFTSAVQFKMHAPTTLPPWQVPWGSEMADGFLQTTKPTTIIILAERSNLLFTRSGATASSLCLSHDSDFGGGRLSCDFEEENVHFSEIFNCFKNDQVQNSYQNIYETAKQKRVFDESAKVPFLLSSLCPPSASLVYGKWKMPPLRRSAIARAFTSAVQFKMHAPTTHWLFSCFI
mgnify:CR=1 FL=1